MNCIFCHQPSDNSKSIEHIVPESLGNKKTVLWRGAICDKCNNYFATKIEKTLLDQPYFISLRNRNFIKTKKNRFVPQKVIVTLKDDRYTHAWMNPDDINMHIHLDQEVFNSIIAKKGQILIPLLIEPEKDNYILSRFLAKCAFEYLVFRTKEQNFIEFSEYLRDKQFEPLRKYARYGEGCKFWPYHQRRIYGEGDMFVGFEGEKEYEILNEMDLLSIELERKTIEGEEHVMIELYFILVIMGIEYTIHLAAPEIDGYEIWLKNKNNLSPVERYGETRTPNTRTDIPLITEELVRKMNHKKNNR